MRKAKHADDLRSLCLIRDNACATSVNWFRISWKRKLWHISAIRCIHQTWVPEILLFTLFTTEKHSHETSVLASKGSCQCCCSVPQDVTKKVHLFAFRAWIKSQETEFLSRENASTGWNEWNVDKSYNAPWKLPVTLLNERPSYEISSQGIVKSK